MPLHLHRSSQKSLPSLPPTISLAGTTPLHPDRVQNKALFGSYVAVHERSDTSSSTSRQPPARRRKSSFQRLYTEWWLEILSLFTMALCLFAIVLTLRLHEDQPLPKWRKFSGLITINALLSVYYTVFKGAMLLVVGEVLSQLKWSWFREPRPLMDLERFSQASRGPIGAVQLLWSLKRRSFSAVLPVAGALLALFALFIDPFTQQIVQFYSCSRVQPELRATIPRTNNFTSPLWSQGSMSYGIGGTGNLTKDMGLQGAIYAGLFDASPVSAAYVPASCPSGNCTFDPYWSLGMCSACQDATPKLDIECKPYSWWNASSLMATGEEWNIGAPLCNFTWADSVSLEPGLLNATWPQFNMTFQRLVAPTAGTTIVGRGKKAPTEPIIDTGEFESQIIWGRFIRWLSPTASPDFSQYIKPLNLDPLAQGIGATECVLYPCIQEYNSHIEGGTFSEQIVSSAPVSVVSEYFLGNKEPAGSVTVRTACLNKNDRDVLTRLGYDLDAETQWLAVNGPDFLNLGEKIDQSCIFSMLGDFSSVLPTITQNLLVPDAANSQGWQGVFGGQPDYYQTGSVLESFYDYGYVTQNSLSARFEGMAAALTSFMRRHSGDVPSSSRVPASGTVWVSDTCVAVEWDWITLPSALLLLASCYFMIAVRSMSRSRYQNAWKSSSVAPLYLGLDSDVRSDMGSLEDLKEMEAIAQRLNVQLKAVGQGWRFAKAGPSEMTDVEQ